LWAGGARRLVGGNLDFTVPSSWSSPYSSYPYKRTPPDPLQETHLCSKASFFHTHIVSIVHLGDSHLVVIEKIGREERRELRRSQIYLILLDFVPLQI